MQFYTFNYKLTKDIINNFILKNHNSLQYDLFVYEMTNLYLLNRCKVKFHIEENQIKFIFKNKFFDDFFKVKFFRKINIKEQIELSNIIVNAFIVGGIL